MKIVDPALDVLHAATAGDLGALDTVLLSVQPRIYNLAVRVLGNRDDAADATQEILLKLVMHLGGFRSESGFSTWVWRLAYNHLMTARTRTVESPEVSLEGIAERLQVGLEFAANLVHLRGEPVPLTPHDKLEALQVARTRCSWHSTAKRAWSTCRHGLWAAVGASRGGDGCHGAGVSTTTVARPGTYGGILGEVLRPREFSCALSL